MGNSNRPGKNQNSAERHRESAAFFLAGAQKAPVEQALQFVKASLIFSALTHEAFVDELATELLEEKERLAFLTAPTAQRLHLLLRAFWYLPDYSSRPFSTATELAGLMNSMVAGMPEQLVLDHLGIARAETTDYAALGGIDWENFCTIDTAERVFNDVERMALDIYSHAGIHVEKNKTFQTSSLRSRH